MAWLVFQALDRAEDSLDLDANWMRACVSRHANVGRKERITSGKVVLGGLVLWLKAGRNCWCTRIHFQLSLGMRESPNL
jgi:hypothetical protein